MRRLMLCLSVMLLAVGMTGIGALADAHEECVDLLAGQDVTAGEVCVSDDGANLTVTYTTIDDWMLTETHLAVSTDAPGGGEWTDNRWQNRKGNPAPGRFPYSTDHDPSVDTFTYTIALANLGATSDDDLHLGAHAVVERGTDAEVVVVSDTDTQVVASWSPAVDGYDTDWETALKLDPGDYPFDAVESWKRTAAEFPLSDNVWESIEHDFDDDALGIWDTFRVAHPVEGDIVQFERTFDLDDEPVSGTLWITCDNGYEVQLGDFVGLPDQIAEDWRGSDLSADYVGAEGWKSVESWDVTDHLVEGENTLTLFGLNEQTSDGSISTNPAGCIFELIVATELETESAWGDGGRFTQRGNWATHFTYTVE